MPYELAICPLRYTEPVSGWVLDAKRWGGLPETRLLADCLMLTVLDVYDREDLPTVLVPVPLSWRRRVYRGHNQALTLAAMISRKLEIPLNRQTLRRHRHTRMQPGLSPAERQRNVSAAFSSSRRWQGQHVAIIDDIMTSGATATATASCLLNAGCGRVDIWCAARAMPS
jgi:ComF family protein